MQLYGTSGSALPRLYYQSYYQEERILQLPSISRHSRSRANFVGANFTGIGIVLGIKLGNPALYSAICILLDIKLGNRHLYQVTCVQPVFVPVTIHD